MYILRRNTDGSVTGEPQKPLVKRVEGTEIFNIPRTPYLNLGDESIYDSVLEAAGNDELYGFGLGSNVPLGHLFSTEAPHILANFRSQLIKNFVIGNLGQWAVKNKKPAGILFSVETGFEDYGVVLKRLGLQVQDPNNSLSNYSLGVNTLNEASFAFFYFGGALDKKELDDLVNIIKTNEKYSKEIKYKGTSVLQSYHLFQLNNLVVTHQSFVNPRDYDPQKSTPILALHPNGDGLVAVICKEEGINDPHNDQIRSELEILGRRGKFFQQVDW